MAPVPVELEIRPPADEDEVVLIADFDQFAAAQTGLACGGDVPYRNSEIAVIVHTGQARTFVKGLRTEHPRVWTQRSEHAINPHVAGIAARLRWQAETGGWHLLGFEVIDGRPVDYSPGSADLPKLRDTLGRLGQLPCPGLPLTHAEQRWSEFSDSPGLFAGAALLHTELSPGNVLITGTCAHLVDWAWPTRGASWIDPACAVVWLIAFGHTPTDAEQWAQQLPAWHTATPTHLGAFAQAQHTMWASIAQDHPDAWLLRAARGAQRWAQHRRQATIEPRSGHGHRTAGHPPHTAAPHPSG